MSVVLYPREVICGECGTAMLLTWHDPFDRPRIPAYRHPDHRGCEYNGKLLQPSQMLLAEIYEEAE
jgi:hypothetical protein